MSNILKSNDYDSGNDHLRAGMVWLMEDFREMQHSDGDDDDYDDADEYYDDVSDNFDNDHHSRAGMVWRTEDSREVEVEVVWTKADLSNLPASVGLVIIMLIIIVICILLEELWWFVCDKHTRNSQSYASDRPTDQCKVKSYQCS